VLAYCFDVGRLTLAVVQIGDTYELRINGYPFNYIIELRRNKEFFKKNVTVNNNVVKKVENENPSLFNFKINPAKQANDLMNEKPQRHFSQKSTDFDSKSIFESLFEKKFINENKENKVSNIVHQSDKSLMTYRNILLDCNSYPELKPIEFKKDEIVSDVFS
jgi:hypothetical protein